MSTTDAFTLEARKNNFTSYGEAKPIEISNISAIYGFQAQNSSGVKIMNTKGQELLLTETGIDQLKSLADEINTKFIPAKDHLNNDQPYMVNPSLVSFNEETIEDDVATITLPSGQSLYLSDEEYGFGLDINETRKALNIENKAPTPPS